MQYMFWQVVVIGGMLTNKPLSVKLLTNSLILFGKETSDLLLEDDKIKGILMKSEAFKNKLRQLTEKYGKNAKEFVIDKNSPVEDTAINFDKSDLLYALHNATLFVKAIKNEDDKWNLKIEIIDTYDFTDFKSINEYMDNKEARIDDIISTTLNNFAVVSSEYGVIKIYDVKIKLETKEGEF